MPRQAPPIPPADAAPRTPERSTAPAPDAAATAADTRAIGPDLDTTIAAWSLSSHIYSESAADRLVIIDGQAYREGDRMPNGVRVEAIGPDGLTVRSGAERRTVDIRTLWR